VILVVVKIIDKSRVTDIYENLHLYLWKDVLTSSTLLHKKELFELLLKQNKKQYGRGRLKTRANNQTTCKTFYKLNAVVAAELCL
jgi:hypothetical protein